MGRFYHALAGTFRNLGIIPLRLIISRRPARMHSRLTSFCALLLSFLLIPPAIAFDTPLSPEAVRDAYFLGQRRGQDFAELLAKYTTSLPAPETGRSEEHTSELQSQ